MQRRTFHRGNFLLEDGEVVEPPNRDIFRRRQEENVERLIKAGLLVNSAGYSIHGVEAEGPISVRYATLGCVPNIGPPAESARL